MNFFNGVKAIFLKDLVCELRRREVLPATIVLAILIGWVFRLAGEDVSGNGALVTAVIVVSSLFATIILSNKNFSVEFSNNCLEAILVSPVDSGNLFISKFLVNTVMLSIFQLFSVPAVCFLFGLNPLSKVAGLVAVLALMNAGFASCATLLSAAMHESRGQNSLLSVLLMALLSPIIVPLIFAFLFVFDVKSEMMGFNSAVSAVGTFGRAVGFTAAFDSIFFAASWLLFDFVIQDQEKA